MTERSSALVPQDDTATSIESMAEAFHKSGMFPDVKSQAQAVVKIVAGRELGLGSVYAMMQLNVIQGKVTLGASAIGALVKRGGRYDYRVTSHSDKQCVIQFTDRNKPVYESTFAIEDARRAGLVKSGSGWEKYPKAMLFSRALTQGARIVCPENLSGVYAHEEMGAEVNEDGAVLSLPETDPGDTSSFPAVPPEGSPAPSDEPMPDHWCDEHHTEYFKRGKMRNYAHPIEGTRDWCNERSEKAGDAVDAASPPPDNTAEWVERVKDEPQEPQEPQPEPTEEDADEGTKLRKQALAAFKEGKPGSTTTDFDTWILSLRGNKSWRELSPLTKAEIVLELQKAVDDAQEKAAREAAPKQEVF
jgi:hypothetical protein